MKKKWLVTMLGAAAMGMSGAAMAQQPMSGWYVGGDIAKVEVESEDDTGFRILGGYEINRTFAAELGYTSLFDKDGVEVTAFELVGIGKFPVANSFSVFGKLGLAMWDAEIDGVGSDDGTDLTYGVGVQYDLTSRLGIRGQLQWYDVDEADADVISVGVIYRF